MVEALDQCISELSMVEQVHEDNEQPFYSKGLELGRKALEAEDG